MSSTPVRVLVVDDSAVVRGLLAKALESDPEITVAGTAMHGEAALRWLSKQPVDVVVLDVEMPVMDGLTALPRILQDYPHTQVVMASAMTYEGAETTVTALRLGAAECIAKPNTGSAATSIEELSIHLVPLVKALGGSKSLGHSGSSYISKRVAKAGIANPRIVTIGTSTGGPNALSKLVSGLPRDFSLPILITQHMPAMFTPMLAKHLEKDGGRPCSEATHGSPIQPGHTYIAPGDFHMAIGTDGDRFVTSLNQGPPEHYCRPSVNPLFRSAAQCYGNAVLAVMLTGMGEDGIEGTRDLAASNSYIIAQDEATSVVWGMPAAVVRGELANEVLPLDEVAPAIVRLCSQSPVTH